MAEVLRRDVVTGGAGPAPQTDPRCGSDRGYQAHRRRNEVPCRACCDAHAEYERSRYRPRPPRSLQPCGTVGGWHRHYRRREEPCKPCRDAKRAAWKPEYAARKRRRAA